MLSIFQDQTHGKINVSWVDDDGITSADVDVGVNSQSEYDDILDEQDDDCVECEDSTSDDEFMEDGGEEENDEQDVDNYEDFAIDLLETSDSIYDQPEDAQPEEDSNPVTRLSREVNGAGSSVTTQHWENTTHPWAGYKIVGDNVDKNIRPSFQRTERQTKSLHYFHACAAKDRIDFSLLSDVTSTEVVMDLHSLLPDDSDVATIKEEFVILISRYLILQQIASY